MLASVGMMRDWCGLADCCRCSRLRIRKRRLWRKSLLIVCRYTCRDGVGLWGRWSDWSGVAAVTEWACSVRAVTRGGLVAEWKGVLVRRILVGPLTLRIAWHARGQVQVVNAAAYTAVDRAESEPDVVFRINAQAPGVIAHWCAEHGVPLVHYSTDYVFDGQGTSPCGVDDPVAPLNIYGASKLAGECAVRAAGGCSLICTRPGFMRRMATIFYTHYAAFGCGIRVFAGGGGSDRHADCGGVDCGCYCAVVGGAGAKSACGYLASDGGRSNELAWFC